MSIYRLRDDDIEHEYENSSDFNWMQAGWVAVSVIGMLLPAVALVGMIFHFW